MDTSLLVHRLLCGRGLESSREEEGVSWELYHTNFLTKSTFFSKLQTAALTMDAGHITISKLSWVKLKFMVSSYFECISFEMFYRVDTHLLTVGNK